MSSEQTPDIVLVNPSSRSRVYQALGQSLSAIEPPVWMGLIATYLRNKGVFVEVIDAEAESLTATMTAERVVEANPLVTAIIVYGHQPSATTQTMPAAGAVCSAIKELAPDHKTILVGGHVASLPERTLNEESVDYVCDGEGPVTLHELVDALKGGRSEDIEKVRGLWYRDGDTVASTPPAPLVQNPTEEMPSLAWDLLPMEKYRAHNWHTFGRNLEREPYASIYTTFGCPYRCTFCCIQAPFKSGEKVLGFAETVNTYRFWDPSVVMAQIDTLVNEYGVSNIKIADEMFVLNRRHVNAICDGIIERGYDLNIWAYARVDTVREGMVEKLKKAGFTWLAFGIEAASERVRVDVQKGFGQDLVYKTVNEVRDAGINVIGNYIFGLPEDDLDTMRETLDMALDLNCEFANFYSAMAYPGSALYDMAIQKNWPLPESWSGYSQHSVDTLPLPTKHLTGPEVLRFRDQAFQEYFRSDSYNSMVSDKFGPDVAQHIADMVSVDIVRNTA